jgi:2-octaprenylphenol hydroxylase
LTIKSDVTIVGGGIVGLTLACLLAKNTFLSIVVLEANTHQPFWTSDYYSPRVSAITLASKQILQHLQVWSDIQSRRAAPFTKVMVWNANHPAALSFDCHDIAESTLGWIIENNLIQTVLREKLKQYSQVQVISPVTLQHLHAKQHEVELVTDQGLSFSTRLAIAADGAHSWLREQAKIAVDHHDYAQNALVTCVETALPHQNIARQVFLLTGPLAFLPLASPNLSSIVWTLPAATAKQYMELDPQQFQETLGQAFSYRLGKICAVTERYFFPLYRQQAKHYVTSRIVLTGDAAHTIHPLAGQGVNMGLLDAAALTDVVVDALTAHRDFSSHYYLRRYERFRRAYNAEFMIGIDILKRVFAQPESSAQFVLSCGLKTINYISQIKNFLTRYAVGKNVNLPRWMQVR